MDSLVTRYISCPQCHSSLATCTESKISQESTITCKLCGYQQITTEKGTDTFKGYGSLTLNDTTVLFHEEVSFQRQQEILKSISQNPNASLFEWTDKYGIVVLKGELPDELNTLMEQQAYYSSFAKENVDGEPF